MGEGKKQDVIGISSLRNWATGTRNPPSNQSMAALAEGGSSKETVASPFSFPVSLSVYRLIMGSPVFLLTLDHIEKDQKLLLPL